MGSDPFAGVDTTKWRFVKLTGGDTKKTGTPSRNTLPTDAIAYRQIVESVRASGEFTPPSADDARETVMASIVRRRGQPAFRRTLLAAYRRKCAVTGCDVTEALEAAHLIPYNGEKTNHPANGILLRADIHTLFDLGLLSVHPTTLSVSVAYSLKQTVYGKLHGQQISLPAETALRPLEACLAHHFVSAGFADYDTTHGTSMQR
ncbi:MAG: HNH endonuclease [Gemmatimonadota bacterium]|nr:HNH endonuclease [Gemmatimonadota bacterium]